MNQPKNNNVKSMQREQTRRKEKEKNSEEQSKSGKKKRVFIIFADLCTCDPDRLELSWSSVKILYYERDWCVFDAPRLPAKIISLQMRKEIREGRKSENMANREFCRKNPTNSLLFVWHLCHLHFPFIYCTQQNIEYTFNRLEGKGISTDFYHCWINKKDENIFLLICLFIPKSSYHTTSAFFQSS